MARAIWIRDLQVGTRVRLDVQVKKAEVQSKAGGELYFRADFSDSSGTIPAIYWNVRPSDRGSLTQMRYAEISGIVAPYQNGIQIKLDALPKPILTPVDLSDFVPRSPLPLDQLRERLCRHIESVTDSYLHALLLDLFRRDSSLLELFEEHPAAETMHHAFRHGLLHHTLEVADTVASIVDCQTRWGWRTVNADLAVTGALLHDIGKTQEITDADSRYEYSPGGQLLGHITQGVLIVARACARIRKASGFPTLLEQTVLHLILSHHGKGDWGSPELPKTPEALILHMADKLSADLFYFQEAAAQAPEGQLFVRQAKLDNGSGKAGRKVYVADFAALLADISEETLTTPVRTASVRPGRLPVLRLFRSGDFRPGMRSVPLVGSAAAGMRLLDSANFEGNWLMEADELSAGDHYLLRVEGDSMSGDGIVDGDLLVVKHREAASPAQIAVVHLGEGAALIKRIESAQSGIQLISSNPNYPPIAISDPEQLRIQGVVIGIARQDGA